MDSPLREEINPSNELEFKRRNLPDKPGCYIYKNKEGEILYVGKAKSLKKRVNSYWLDRSGSEDYYYTQKIKRLVSLIYDIDVFVVENEMEAILLENQLIKEHMPEYNAMLKDNKSYPWIQITKEKFPRVRIIRGPERYGLQHTYIGPFVDGGDLKQMVKYVRKIIPFCSCKRPVNSIKRSRPCTYHQIKLCPAPCTGLITEEEYHANIKSIEQLFRGNIEEIRDWMKNQMNEAASTMAYEDAARWRERLQALEIFAKNQSIFSYDLGIQSKDFEANAQTDDKTSTTQPKGREYRTGVYPIPEAIWTNLDVVAGHFSAMRAGIIIIHVRNGKLTGKTPYIVDISGKIASKKRYLSSFIKQHYLRDEVPVPDQIVVKTPLPPADEQALVQYFNQIGRQVTFRGPSEEDKTAGLLRIAQKNIELLITQKDEYDQHLQDNQKLADQRSKIQKGLEELKEVLHLSDLPLIIEGFDMAHTQGTDYTGSMVCLVEGKPSKSHYRRYKVKEVSKPDDVAAMKEVLTRRYTRAIKEGNMPDLIVLDGGKPQLNMAHLLFQELGIERVPHIGLVKPEGRSEVYQAPRIVVPGQSHQISLAQDSPALHLIQQLRDESHRFANAYHRKLREKRQTKSELDDIPGVGPSRKRKLLTFFGSIAEIKQATEAQLAEVVGSALAAAILTHFQTKTQNFLEIEPKSPQDANMTPTHKPKRIKIIK